MAISKFGQTSGTLPNGGKFYTAQAIGNMEIEMPGGSAGVTETLSGSCYTAGHTLVTAVAAAVVAAGSGSLSAGGVTTLSGALAAARAAGL